MSADVQAWLPTVVMVPLVSFLLYRRYKRTFGRQAYTRRRMMFRIVLLSSISVFFLVTTRTTLGFVAAAVGAILGAGLAAVGVALTTFERSDAGIFYTPNAWIGLAISALFLGRLGARFFSIYEAMSHAQPGAPPSPELARSPRTAGIFFLMAAYYVVYYAAIIRKSGAPASPAR